MNEEIRFGKIKNIKNFIVIYIILFFLHELGHLLCFILFQVEINYIYAFGFNVPYSEFANISEFFITLIAIPFLLNVLYLITCNKSKYWLLIVIYLLKWDILIFITKLGGFY